MSKPKVLIHVVGGVAHWSSTGDVDVVVFDEDNIRAGDPPVQLSHDWEALVRRIKGKNQRGQARYISQSRKMCRTWPL